MVPGSTLMYGSSLTIATLRPRASRIAPSEAAAMPLPSDDTTPPVTQMNLVMGATVAGEARREGSLADRGVVPPLEFGRFADGHGSGSVPDDAPRRFAGRLNPHSHRTRLQLAHGECPSSTP